MADWLRENYYTAEGKAFEEFQVPWVTAPGGPCDAVDDPAVRWIWLQWASRMFKTQFGQGVQMKYAHLDPCPMMFATVDETLCKQIFGRLWGMLEHCPPLRNQCPPERLQSKHEIELRNCAIPGAWAQGKSRLADKAARVIHGNEISKWVHQATSTEGDPLPRFQKRTDEFADAKGILESTPAARGSCRVEHGRLQSSNHRYKVPCPHCAWFQALKLGDGKEPPGIFWTKNEAGKSDPDLAKRTAYYVCGHCRRDIRDIHRPEMMNLGVWVPEGCTVDHDRAIRARELPPDDKSWLIGYPVRSGQDYGSQLSSLYALFNSWGAIARKFLIAKLKIGELRQFINEDLAETFDVIQRKQTWEQLGQRLICDVPRWIVPNWGSLLTVGIDRQEDHYVWNVDAWGPGRSSHTVAYGDADDLGWIFHNVLQKSYEHQDGGLPLMSSFALIDSGHRPEGVYEFCRDVGQQHGIHVWPCKGSSTALDSEYRQSTLGKDTSMPGMVLFRIDTFRTQSWIDKQLHILRSPDQGSHTLHAGSMAEHQDYLEQLLNDAAVTDLDEKGYERESWRRPNTGIPNDFRDTRRYGYVSMLVATRGAEIRPRAQGQSEERRPAVVSAGRTRESRW